VRSASYNLASIFTYTYISFSQVQKAADRLAWHYSKAALVPKIEPGHIPTPQIIAVLTSSAFDESLLEIALAKLGLTALLLSVNNSVAAVAHLIKLTKATHLVYGTKFVAEANEAQEILKAEGYELGIVPDKRFPLWGPEGVENATIKAFPAALTPEQETDRPGVILHSSGSVCSYSRSVILPCSLVNFLCRLDSRNPYSLPIMVSSPT